MNYTKLLIPIIIFFIIANPVVYRLTMQLPVIGKLIADPAGRPTQVGVAVHAVVYALVAHFTWKLAYGNK